MNCRELVELLCDFVANELPEDQRALIEQHLCKCPPCVVYVETYRLTITVSRKLPDAPVPNELLDRVRAALREMERED